MPNHTERSHYFTLRPNQSCQNSQKHPAVQSEKLCTEHKICISLRLKTFFEMFLQSHVRINNFLTQLLFQCSYCRCINNFGTCVSSTYYLLRLPAVYCWQIRLNIHITYLTHWKVQFREFFQLCDETTIIGFKSIGNVQWQDLQIWVQGHDISQEASANLTILKILNTQFPEITVYVFQKF